MWSFWLYLMLILHYRYRCLIQRSGSMLAQVNVCWSGLDAALATWEDTEALKSTFPNASAWGQATSEEEGDVSHTT